MATARAACKETNSCHGQFPVSACPYNKVQWYGASLSENGHDIPNGSAHQADTSSDAQSHIAPKNQRIIHNGNKRTQAALAPYHQQPEQRNTCTAQHYHRIGPRGSCSPKANHPRQQKQIKAKKIPTEILAKPICPISNTFPMALHSLIHCFSLRLTTTQENTPPMTTDKNI